MDLPMPFADEAPVEVALSASPVGSDEAVGVASSCFMVDVDVDLLLLNPLVKCVSFSSIDV